MCPRCGSQLHDRTATERRPHLYLSSALPDLFLVGIQVRSCRRCGHETPKIPRSVRLSRLIADRLLGRPNRLRGDQVRFLRRQVGFDAKRLATLMGISAEHLSRIENGRTPPSETLDRLARAIVAAALGSRAARGIIVDHAEPLATDTQPKPLIFKAKNNDWNAET